MMPVAVAQQHYRRPRQTKAKLKTGSLDPITAGDTTLGQIISRALTKNHPASRIPSMAEPTEAEKIDASLDAAKPGASRTSMLQNHRSLTGGH